MSDTLTGKRVDRRGFLRGSAIFAAALGIAAVPAFAQQQSEPKDKEKDKEKDTEKKPPKDPFDTGDEGGSQKLVDKEGREYRICPQCGYNMYKEGRMWVCENCGYSYVE